MDAFKRKLFIMQYLKRFLTLILTTLSVVGIIRSLRGDLSLREPHVIIISAFICVGVSLLFSHVVKNANKRLVTISLVIGFFFSCFLLLGRDIYIFEYIPSYGDAMLYSLMLTPFMSACVAEVIWLFRGSLVDIKESKVEKLCKKLCGNEKRFLLITAGLMFMIWFICLMATYPGIYAYDSIYQLRMFDAGEVTGHHPILHTYMLGGLINLGNKLFGSKEIGMFLYSIIQMLIMTGIFTYTIKRLKGVIPDTFRVIIWAFYTFIPYNILLSFSGTKDVIFSGLFLLVIIKTYDLIKGIKRRQISDREIVSYVALVFLMCAFRNNGIYAFLVMAILLIILGWKKKKVVIGITCAVVLMWGVFTGPFYSILGIERGQPQEMLSVPIQQVTAVLIHNQDVMTKEEQTMAKEYMWEWDYFMPRIADNVKNSFDNERFSENKAEFLKLWIGVGKKDIRTYIDCWLDLSLGYWYPDCIYPIPGAYHPYIEYENSVPNRYDTEENTTFLQRHSYFPRLENWLSSFSYETKFQAIPVFSMLFSPGFAFWVCILLVGILVYNKKYIGLVPLALCIGLWLTLLLSPVVLFRYMYPVIIAIPYMLAKTKEEIGDKKYV